jgi:hypothetical protein
VNTSWLDVGISSFQWFLFAAGLRLPHTLSGLNALGPEASVPDTVAAIQSLAPRELDELRRFVLEAGRDYYGTLRGRELSAFLERLHQAHLVGSSEAAL